ncbi:hypothetical protein L2D08_10155 [Domibacillus sp. PGB-M46]|uniref:hypothetical protein n=1 Tax=Domibacillus sp. PGB-M46 TaxID=2910255 RepID=UPI001F5A7F1C|nr:hypothetical protein [Domibacillus sp. PGB-M46]MCI2254727.1 hypothetical protein [Domibacillus sp. PGB-M46]
MKGVYLFVLAGFRLFFPGKEILRMKAAGNKKSPRAFQLFIKWLNENRSKRFTQGCIQSGRSGDEIHIEPALISAAAGVLSGMDLCKLKQKSTAV